MRRSKVFLGLLVVAGLSGCRDIATPRLLDPGSAQVQAARARRFDPFPENDVGPSTVSMRPPGFEREYPEPERADFKYLRSGPVIHQFPPGAVPAPVPVNPYPAYP